MFVNFLDDYYQRDEKFSKGMPPPPSRTRNDGLGFSKELNVDGLQLIAINLTTSMDNYELFFYDQFEFVSVVQCTCSYFVQDFLVFILLELV